MGLGSEVVGNIRTSQPLNPDEIPTFPTDFRLFFVFIFFILLLDAPRLRALGSRYVSSDLLLRCGKFLRFGEDYIVLHGDEELAVYNRIVL